MSTGTIRNAMFALDDVNALEREIGGYWLRLHGYPGLHFHVYPQYAFATPEAEQTICVARAAKHAGDNGVRFWIAALAASSNREAIMATEAGRSRYSAWLRSAEFQPLDESQFNALVAAQCADLGAPLALPLHPPGSFVVALALFTLKTDLFVSLVAEYDDELIHFSWTSTA